MNFLCLSIGTAISIVLVEIIVAALAGNLLQLRQTGWINFLTGEGVKHQRDEHFEQLTSEEQGMALEWGVSLQTHVQAGHKVETIVLFCQEGGFDLLLIGFMGHSRIFEQVWGSTFQNLTRLAECCC